MRLVFFFLSVHFFIPSCAIRDDEIHSGGHTRGSCAQSNRGAWFYSQERENVPNHLILAPPFQFSLDSSHRPPCVISALIICPCSAYMYNPPHPDYIDLSPKWLPTTPSDKNIRIRRQKD
jgi:hypothetical protein